MARHQQRPAPTVPARRARPLAERGPGRHRRPGDRPRAAAPLRAGRASTRSSWPAAAARSRTCGASTTSGSCAPWPTRRCRSSSASATSRTSRWPTSPPTCARRRRAPPPSSRTPDGTQLATILGAPARPRGCGARLAARPSAADSSTPRRARSRGWRPTSGPPGSARPTCSTAAARALGDRLERRRMALAAAHDALRTLSPVATLERGYAVARTADGRILRDAADVAAGRCAPGHRGARYRGDARRAHPRRRHRGAALMIDDARLAVLTDEELARRPFDELVAALQRTVQGLEARQRRPGGEHRALQAGAAPPRRVRDPPARGGADDHRARPPRSCRRRADRRAGVAPTDGR